MGALDPKYLHRAALEFAVTLGIKADKERSGDKDPSSLKRMGVLRSDASFARSDRQHAVSSFRTRLHRAWRVLRNK